MIYGVFRAGRMVARSGRAGKPAPREWGWVGKLVFVVIAVVLAVQWWRPVLIVAGVLVLLTVLLVMGGEPAKRAEPRPDPLDSAMADLLGKED